MHILGLGAIKGIREDWVNPLARAGYSARGLIYLIVGGLSVGAALGISDKTGSDGAVRTLLSQPFGTALVVLLVIGLGGLVTWRAIQVVFDTDRHGTGLKGLAIRTSLAGSAAAYAGLALYALALVGAMRAASGGSSGSSAWQSLIDAINGIVGTKGVSLAFALVLATLAAGHIWKAVTRRYAKRFDAPANAMTLIHTVSMSGLIARGAVFAVLALLALHRFRTAEDSLNNPPSLEEALRFIHSLPLGDVLLAATGLGLAIFAGYSFLEARWRRIDPDTPG